MIPQKNRARGKRNERAYVGIIPDTKRVGIMGGEDLSHPMFSVECKSRKSMVVETWFKQAEANCPADKTPLLILHTHHQKRGNDLVCMRLQDWLDWYGELNKEYL